MQVDSHTIPVAETTPQPSKRLNPWSSMQGVPPWPAADQQGATLLEIIVVMIVIGIVTAAVIDRVTDTKTELYSWGDRVKVHLRYAQMRAMNSDRVWGVNFSQSGSTAQYFLFEDRNRDKSIDIPTEQVRLPGENDLVLTLPTEIQLTAGLGSLSFDNWGRPYTHVHKVTEDPSDSCFQEASSGTTVTLAEGTATMDVTVTPNTGFIP